MCSILCGSRWYNEIFIRYTCIVVKAARGFAFLSVFYSSYCSLLIQSFRIAHCHSRRVPAEGSINRRLYSQATHEWLRQLKSVFSPYKYPPSYGGILAVTAKLSLEQKERIIFIYSSSLARPDEARF